jgi:hypothetical protein
VEVIMAGWPAHIENQVLKREAAASSASRFRSLLERYPQVSGSEAAEILKNVRKMRYVEMDQMAADEAVRRQLDRFLRTHKEELRYSPTEIVTIISLVVAFLAICWVLWHSIGGAS